MILLDLSPALRVHVALAVRDRIRQLRRNGIAVPPELGALANALWRPGEDRTGQERSEVAPTPGPGDRGATDGSAPPLLLPAPGAARRLGISERSLRRRVAAGDLTRVRIGRRVLYDPAELDEYVRRQRGAEAVDAGGARRVPG